MRYGYVHVCTKSKSSNNPFVLGVRISDSMMLLTFNDHPGSPRNGDGVLQIEEFVNWLFAAIEVDARRSFDLAKGAKSLMLLGDGTRQRRN